MTPEAPLHLRQKWLIVVNPAAGSGRVGRLWPTLYNHLITHLPDHQVVLSEAQGHATVLTQQAIEQGFRYILAVGGDGTNHEVVNGIMLQKVAPTAEITYALLPVGTGNDWIKTHQIPRPIEEWLQMFLKGKTRLQNIGHLQYYVGDEQRTRYFANVAGLAYDGYVVQFTEQKAPVLPGRVYYLMVILFCIFRYRLQRALLRFGDRQISDRYYTINVGVCRYSGGGMQLVPQADPTGSQLALTYAGPVSKLGVILNTYRFYNGTIGEHPLVTTTHAEEVAVEESGDGPLLLEADGEFLGQTPVKITLQHLALRFIAP